MDPSIKNDIIVLDNGIPKGYRLDNTGIHKRIIRYKTPLWAHVTSTPCMLSKLRVNAGKDMPTYEYELMFKDALGNIKEVWVDQKTLLTKRIIDVLQNENAVCTQKEAGKLNEYFSRYIVQASLKVGGAY